MAFNIMDLVQEQLTPKNIGALAGLLGEDDKKTASGIAGMVPAMLGGLLGTFGKPEGRKAFGAAVDAADTGFIGNIAGMLGGGSSSLISSGLKMASSLFGDNKIGLLSSAISSFSGLSSGSTKSLLGIAAPLVMSMLSKKKKQDGLDTGGLIDMLTGQKDNIRGAIPAGLSNSLGDSGILHGLMDTAGAGVNATASAARSAAASTQQAAKKSKSLLNRLLPLIIIALVAWFAFQYFSKPKQVEKVAGPAAVTTAAAKALTVDNINLGEKLTALFGTAGKTLAGITDVESARNAVGSLGEVDQALDVVTNLAAKLAPEGHEMLTKIITKLAPGLEKAITTVTAIPGVSDVLGDTLTSLLQKLSALAKT